MATILGFAICDTIVLSVIQLCWTKQMVLRE